VTDSTSYYISPPRFVGVGERTGVERPALEPSDGRGAFMPGRSNGLLASSLAVPSLLLNDDLESTLLALVVEQAAAQKISLPRKSLL
jgi:hypothetical protein